MQTILNFKLETTNEKLTPRTGVIIFGEYLKGLDFKNIVNNEIVVSKHHKAYNPFCKYGFRYATWWYKGKNAEIAEIRSLKNSLN